MLELLDQYERLTIALKLKRGKLNKAKQGGFAGGTRALGYQAVKLNGKSDIAIDPDEAKTISPIKRLRRKGLTLAAIADHLNASDISTKRGGQWHASTIKYILDNPLYRGLFEYADVRAKRSDLAIR
jgi:DNA invertase Pin-like site-specific DNA recombinase